MYNHPVGQAYSLLAALTWGAALVLFKHSGDRIAPIALNLFKNAIGLTLLLLTLGGLALVGRAEVEVMRVCSWWDIGILMLSGIIGIALADTLFFHALNLIGVGLIAIVDCAYSPSVILFSWLLLSERLTAFHYLGTALVIGGILIASRHDRPPNRTRGQVAAGVLLAAAAVSMMGFGIVIAKPTLAVVPIIWATTLRMIAGSALLAVFATVGRQRKSHWAVFRPSVSWKTAIPASVLGSFLAMVFWVAGFKYTYASVAGILNQTTVVFATILATIFLREPLGPRKIVAVAVALGGVAVVTFSNWLADQWNGFVAPTVAALITR